MRPYLIILLFAALFLHCKKSVEVQPGPGAPTQKQAPADALFVPVAPGESGIDFANVMQEDHASNVLVNSYLYNGGGVGVIDADRDGLQDLFFVSTLGECRLYRNLGNFKFEDITQKAGIDTRAGHKTGVSIIDINADGWQDIYLCRTGMKADDSRRNLLFINNQNGTFTEQSRAYGLADGSPSNHANFFDADGDGDLDCYVLNYPTDFKKVNSARVRDAGGGNLVRLTEPENDSESDRLYRNNGNNTFTDISRQAGIWNRAFGLSVTATDLNEDGFTDLLVGNDYIEPDFAYVNNPAQPGNFTDKARGMFRHSSNHTMGVDIADLNNDGLNDIVALDMLAETMTRQKVLMTTMLLDRYTTLTKMGYGDQSMRNVLQINNGNGTFSEIGCLAGIYNTDWSWSPLIQDFDNDGLRDLFISNGYRRDVSDLDYLTYTYDSIQKTGGLTVKRFPKIEDYLNLIPATPLQKYLFRNRGDLTFEDASTAWGLVELSYSNGAAYADLDNDGDMDLIFNNIDGPASVYRNRAAEQNKGRWLQVKLNGAAPNTGAVGARVRIYTGETIQYQELTPFRGYFSSVEPLLHFGLGNMEKIDRVEVEFPGNKLVVLENVPANQRLTVDIADAKPGKLSPLKLPEGPRMRELGAPAFTHQEDEVQDFNRERLLPWKLSTPGPLVASADVNGDKLDDFYVGNAAGSPGVLFLQKGGGSFQPTSAAAWEADKGYEDTGSVFFDADGDGDLDLCVSSGGNSALGQSPTYQTRLYRNDGRGNFTRAQDALPTIQTSTSAVLAADYDQDGDLDLLLGGWCTPGAYPSTPPSYVLRNDGGRFTDATDQAAPAFRQAGMVRGMIWTDLDGDQKPELVVNGEWMPIQVYTAGSGKLTPATERFGLQNTNGFWRSLAAADLDGDGDQDLIAGNLGWNTRYEAGPEAPIRMFAKDFDGNGSIDPIMTVSENGRDVPVAYRELILKQLPPLKKKYLRHSVYAQAAIGDMFSEADIQKSQQLAVTQLGSAVFINENGKFALKNLPAAAQAFPTHGIAAVDWQNDGDLDLLLVGNDYGQQVETGRIDAGNGLLLVNDGKANFSALPARASGLWATREARDIKILRGSGNKRYTLVTNNNDKLQLFEMP